MHYPCDPFVAVVLGGLVGPNDDCLNCYGWRGIVLRVGLAALVLLGCWFWSKRQPK